MGKPVKSYPFFLYLFLSLVLIFFDSKGFLSGSRKLVQKITIPAESRFFSVRQTILSPLSWFSTRGSLEQKIRSLEEDRAILYAQIANLSAIAEEEKHDRLLLGSNAPVNWLFEPARVISSLPDSIFAVTGEGESFVPNRGATAVLGDGKLVFIGRVSEVIYNNRIKIDLPTNESSKIPVLVRDKNGNRQGSGILIGRGGKMILDQVLTKEEIKAGDLVLTSGDGGFPPELLVGYVTKILPVSDETFKKAEVQEALDPYKLEYVFFVKKF